VWAWLSDKVEQQPTSGSAAERTTGRRVEGEKPSCTGDAPPVADKWGWGPCVSDGTSEEGR
jgi:hypothetical protein